ncbi:MAG: DUF928 domain-containing protein [Leptolyngbyaceae cyanobacterium bins.302]|nr:DUF928 domain-containing protein [Leptolyngbyaceae cyanobacterium bins.302]
MNKSSVLFHSAIILSCYSILICSKVFNLYAAEARAADLPTLAQRLESILQFKQPLGDDNQDPGNRTSGGPRVPETLCSQAQGKLTALVPANKQVQANQETGVLGYTIATQPTFWFYSPYQPKQTLSAELEIRELVNGKVRRVSQQTLTMPSTPGLLPVQLQNTSLETGKKYQWLFTVQCVPNEPSANDTATGWVKRVDNAQLQNQSQSMKAPKQRVQAYAQAGLWHETITTIAGELCRSDRKQAQQWFSELLRSVNLGDVAKQPKANLLQSCPKL